MKWYLILLTASIIARVIVEMEVHLHFKRNYKALYATSIAEQILAHVKAAILTVMIVPSVLSLLCDLFAHDAFIEGIDENFESDERFEKIS